MLAIRMRRLGSKKRPFYRVVVIDSHKARDGRALEVLGHYNPTTVPETFKIDKNRVDHWISRGAQPSETLRTLLTRPVAIDVEPADGPAVPVVQAVTALETSVAGPALGAVQDPPPEADLASEDAGSSTGADMESDTSVAGDASKESIES